MAIQDKTTLEGYFNTGDIPTEANFKDLIDSLRHQDQPWLSYQVVQFPATAVASNTSPVTLALTVSPPSLTGALRLAVLFETTGTSTISIFNGAVLLFRRPSLSGGPTLTDLTQAATWPTSPTAISVVVESTSACTVKLHALQYQLNM